MNTLADIIGLMQTDGLAYWRLSRLRYGQRLPAGQHLVPTAGEGGDEVTASSSRLANLVRAVGPAHYEIELLKSGKAHSGSKTILEFRHGTEAEAGENQGQSLGLGLGLVEELRGQMEMATNGLLAVERQKSDGLVSQLRAEMAMLIREKDLERKEEAIKNREKELKELEVKFSSDSEKLGNGLGMVLENVLGKLMPGGLNGLGGIPAQPEAVPAAALTPTEQLIDLIATSLAESGQPLESIKVVAKIVNSYLHQPDAPIWNVFKTSTTNA